MSIYGGPDIITNGLVLYLDAANSKSYSGSGATWNDLSSNNLNGTLTNGPTFNSSNGGSIVFDATNDRVTSTINFSPISTDGISWLVAMSPDSSNGSWPQSYRYIISFINSFGQHYGTLVEATTGNGIRVDVPNSGGTRIGFNTQTNINGNLKYFLAVTWISGIFTVYLNGIQIATTTVATYTPSSITGINIGCHPNSISNFWGGNIYSVQLYNRRLLRSEILQNYNALKGRFGL